MGKSSKRKAQATVGQTTDPTDSPKKAKLELTNKLKQKSPTAKKNKLPPSQKTKVPVKLQKNKNTLKAKINHQEKIEGSTTGNQFIIPNEFAQNLNKRAKQAVSKKVRNLIKIRQARGEDINEEEINKLVKEIIQQKTSTKTDNLNLANDQKTNKPTVIKSKDKHLMKKKKIAKCK